MPTSPENKRKTAVGLRYDREKEESPRVIAKGRGAVADKLIELAELYNIPLYEDSDLVEVLSKLELNQEIPPHTYAAVAEILAFIYQVNQEME